MAVRDLGQTRLNIRDVNNDGLWFREAIVGGSHNLHWLNITQEL